MPILLGSGIYRRSSYGSWHPLRVPRVSTVIDLARAMGWLSDAQYRTSPRAKASALGAWHHPDYVAAVQEAEDRQQVSDSVRERYRLGTSSNPVFPEMFRRPATSVGGSMLAGMLAARGGIVHHPAGGTHHGMPGRANGFCYFNDPVFAILSLRANGVRRIAYIDIDAHHPDGVEHAFGQDRDILTISTHEEARWPRTGAIGDRGAGQVFNLPLPRGTGDDGMALARDHVMMPALDRFDADSVVLQCGSDGLTEDPQSGLALSNNAHRDVLRSVMARTSRLIVLGGGGYNPWSVGRCWTGLWAVLNGHAIPDRLPEKAETVLRGLRWSGNRRGVDPPEHWFTTLADAARPGPVEGELRARIESLSRRIDKGL